MKWQNGDEHFTPSFELGEPNDRAPSPNILEREIVPDPRDDDDDDNGGHPFMFRTLGMPAIPPEYFRNQHFA